MKKLALIVLFGVAALVSACNTVEGVGRDVQGAGEAVSDTARTVKDKL
ncbi:entericidin, EcnA/B family [Oleomonas cavernae]|uniref:Entericidin, EcnA/B family n=1 Tax=Oleomonas cavernae TaxID=2320859 RepID=A0A418VUN5_9PROT|nr:entericidin A/B family lipoprotein [Oleomonas cavernae]RJF80843.1 entericidin, EcnA/B family [Oleomonas cavernae]